MLTSVINRLNDYYNRNVVVEEELQRALHSINIKEVKTIDFFAKISNGPKITAFVYKINGKRVDFLAHVDGPFPGNVVPVRVLNNFNLETAHV